MKVEEKLHDVAKNNSLLIMGDSQMQKFSLDSIDGDIYNIASAGEHYFFTYSKLQRLVAADNHKIKTIVLGMSLHNFSPVFMNAFDWNDPEGKEGLQRYLYFFDLFHNEFMRPHQIILNKDFFLGVIKGPEWGGHDATFGKDPDVALIEGGLKFLYGDPINEKVSAMQEFFLDKIVELCKQENISLVFVSAPAHQYYKSHVNEAYYEALRKVADKHSNVLYLNFLTDSTPSIHFSDATHLNKDGAEIYSRKINLELKNRNTANQVVLPTGN
ncbi:MAG TPA: hypothetical protein VFD46_11120, partial [Chryseolinea sp.]|nr:hypothetical protein [Chryseolinea sp.]